MTTNVASTTIHDAHEISEVESPLLDDIVRDSFDYKVRPSIRSKSCCWRSSVYIIGAGLVERFVYYGTSGNMLSYLTGQLGQSTATATSNLNAWSGVVSLSPILGAFIADSFTGRFWAIIISCVLYILGLIFLPVSALLISFHNSECEKTTKNATCSPSQPLIVFFFFSLYLVALAQGGHLPSLQAFGADQFDDGDEKECKAKSSFFNWRFGISAGGIVVPLLALNYIQDDLGWVYGFGITSAVMALALTLFLAGTPTYRFRVKVDRGNPFLRISRVFVKAFKNWRATPTVCIDGEATAVFCSKTNVQFKFLDKALLASDGLTEEEAFCTEGDVEDARSVLRLIPIWCTTMGYSIVYAQPTTLFTKQAVTMDRHIFTFEIPPASFQVYFIILPIVILVPLYDRLLIPIVRAITKKPIGISMLQRIGIGLLMSLVSMLCAAIIEKMRLTAALKYGLVDMPKATIPMSILWLAPQYLLSCVADVFTLIGLQESFYEQVPSDLKSIGMALYISIIGIGSLLSSFMVFFIQKLSSNNGQDGWFSNNINRAHIDYFYWLLFGINTVGFGAYIYFAKSYVYRRRI